MNYVNIPFHLKLYKHLPFINHISIYIYMIYSHIIIYIYIYIYMYKLLHHINSAPCFSNLVATGMALKRYAATRTLGQFSEMIDQSHGIVSSTAGSNYFVAWPRGRGMWPWLRPSNRGRVRHKKWMISNMYMVERGNLNF